MDEIIFNIGIYLKLGEIYKLCCVNKKCESVLGSNYFWKLKYIYDYGDNQLDSWKKEYINFKPKRPGTAYIIYLSNNIQRIKNNNPGIINGDMCKIAAIEWKALNSKIKDIYIENVANDKIRYAREMLIYTENHESIGSKESRKYVGYYGTDSEDTTDDD